MFKVSIETKEGKFIEHDNVEQIQDNSRTGQVTLYDEHGSVMAIVETSQIKFMNREGEP